MKVSDYIVEFLIEKGITDVFGYPGGMVTHLIDSFQKYNNKIKIHLNYHEQAAAFAACGYADVNNKVGVAYATSGPGATNLITGIANAYFDSIPCIFITGQVNTYESKNNLYIRQKGFQETDIVNIVKTITKYSIKITNVNQITKELEKSYNIAINERKGPVLIDIPMDIQRQDIYVKKNDIILLNENLSYDINKFKNIINQIKLSKRPCVLFGAGIKHNNLNKELKEFIENVKCPIVSSMISVGTISTNTLNYYGFIGAYGNRVANFIVAKSDLIISIGSRLDCRQTGDIEKFAPNAKLLRIDIDDNEFKNKIKEDEIQIKYNLKDKKIFDILQKELNNKLISNWLEICNIIKNRLQFQDKNYITDLIISLSEKIKEDVNIITDVGQNQVWIAQSFIFKDNQNVLFSGGHGAMGYSIPAAIGAYYANKKLTYSFNGDGGFQMNIQELEFISREKLPIKIIIFNNYSLGMIRHFQEMYFKSNYVQTKLENGYSVPNLKKIAFAYEIDYYKIKCNSDIDNIEEILNNNKPAIIEIILKADTYVLPKLMVGKPLQDQEPLLDRKLYEYIMNL